MRISTKGRYSLEALLYMALLSEGRLTSAKTIAESINMSDGYLEQLFIPLRRAGIILGARGPQGGYHPARSIAEIKVGDVLRAVEGTLQPTECATDTDVCPSRDFCMSRHTWRELYAAITDCVDSISLKDLVDAYYAPDRIEYNI
ncbi:MAG: Rrf2 family transcriptional regulator [Treponema sp.]|jgi:Rrf2 family protein|nr:Rrf2 family transcriptional regulator [Treponema sp.]